MRFEGKSEQDAIETAIHFRILRQPTRQHADRVVAAIAVPSEFDPLRPQQNIDARAIKRRAERIRVQRLPPVVVSLRMAHSAIRRLRERAGLNEVIALNGSIARNGNYTVAESKVVALADFVRIRLPLFSLLRLLRCHLA